jgi:hypothetical protein
LEEGEYATVHAEEYFSTRGNDGPRRVKQHMQDLYRFFEDVLGPPVRLREVV